MGSGTTDMARHRAEVYGELVKQNVEAALREADDDSRLKECPTLTGIVRVANRLGVDPFLFFPSPDQVDAEHSAAPRPGTSPDAQ